MAVYFIQSKGSGAVKICHLAGNVSLALHTNFHPGTKEAMSLARQMEATGSKCFAVAAQLAKEIGS